MLHSKRKAPPMPMVSYEKHALQASRQHNGSFDLNLWQSHAYLLSDIEKNQMRLLIEAFQSRRLKQIQPIHMYFK